MLSQIQLTIDEHKFEDILPYRWITIQEQNEFSDFLESHGIPCDDIRNCAMTWKKYPCSVNPNHSKKVIYAQCGHRGKCPRDSMSYAHHRANICYRFIKENVADRVWFDLKMNQITLTLPKVLEDMDTKLFSRMLKDFAICYDLEAYGYSIHTRRSEDPLGSRRVHGHLISFNFDVDRDKLKDSTNDLIDKTDYWFDVDQMRETWKAIIEVNTNQVFDEVDLHVEYCSILKDREKSIHLLAYLYRYPVKDLFDVQIRKKTRNYFKATQFKNSVLELLREKKPRLVWCGLMSSSKRKKLQELLSEVGYSWLKFPEIERKIKLEADQCVDCKSPYSPYPCECGVYEGDNEPRGEYG